MCDSVNREAALAAVRVASPQQRDAGRVRHLMLRLGQAAVFPTHALPSDGLPGAQVRWVLTKGGWLR